MARTIAFLSHGTIGLIDETGENERILRPDVPNQISWHIGPMFSDRQHVVLMSIEEGKPWEGTVPSHLWKYNLETGDLEEICTKDRPAPYMPACALLPGDERIVVNPVIDGEQQVYVMDLDGRNQHVVTHEGEGFTYGVSPSPDFTKLAFHATGAEGYRVFVTDMNGGNRTLLAGGPGHLYFGPTWSHDGQWLLYVDCHPQNDPGHDWANLCLNTPGGTDHRVITHDMRHWFGTSYGSPDTRGSGSNVPQWSPSENVFTYTRTLPGSRTAWQFRPERPDTDHFNRDYVPEEACGGTELVLMDVDENEKVLTSPGERVWDFRTAWSPEGDRIAFCRARIGEPAGLWIMNADGSDQQFLTTGTDGRGADHPVWL